MFAARATCACIHHYRKPRPHSSPEISTRPPPPPILRAASKQLACTRLTLNTKALTAPAHLRLGRFLTSPVASTTSYFTAKMLHTMAKTLVVPSLVIAMLLLDGCFSLAALVPASPRAAVPPIVYFIFPPFRCLLFSIVCTYAWHGSNLYERRELCCRYCQR